MPSGVSGVRQAVEANTNTGLFDHFCGHAKSWTWVIQRYIEIGHW